MGNEINREEGFLDTVFKGFNLDTPQTEEEHERFLNELKPHNTSKHIATELDIGDSVKLVSDNFNKIF